MKKNHSILFQVGAILQDGVNEVTLADLSIPLRNGTPSPARFLTGFYGHKGKRAGLSQVYAYATDHHPDNRVMIAEVEVTMKKGLLLGVLKEEDVADGLTNFMNLSRMSSAFSEIVFKIWDGCCGYSRKRGGSQGISPTSPTSYVPASPACIEAIFDAYPELVAVAYPAATGFGEASEVVQMISVDLTRCGKLSASTYQKDVALKLD